VAQSTQPSGFSAKQSGKRTALEIGALVVILVLLFFLGRFVVGCAAEAAAMALPVSIDQQIGAAAAKQMSLQHGKDASPAQQARVQKIFDELMAQVPAEEKAVLAKATVKVVVDATPNAFALPGGQVFVLTGLLDRVGDGVDGDAQIRGVLAHELGHAVRRHGMRLIARSLAFNIALSLLLGGGDQLTGTLVGGAARLESLSNSRDMETEADDFGVGLLTRGGHDTEGLAKFLESLGSQPVPQLLSTHPDPVARAKRIREKSGK
jgi:predicted Zn-dependent protease